MTVSKHFEQLMHCLVQVVGRAAIPEARVREIVGTGAKQLRAFNLADGSQTQKQIAQATGIDQGNLSRTFQRWVEAGIAFWIGEGKDVRPLHVYPITGKGAAKSPNNRPAKRRGKRQ